MDKTSVLNTLHQAVKTKFPRDIKGYIVLKEVEIVENYKFVFFLYYYIDEFDSDFSCQLCCAKIDDKMCGIKTYTSIHYSFVDKKEFLKKCKNANCLINLFPKEKYDHDKKEIYYMYGL